MQNATDPRGAICAPFFFLKACQPQANYPRLLSSTILNNSPLADESFNVFRLIAHDSFSVVHARNLGSFLFLTTHMELKSKSVRLFCAVVESGSLLAAADKIALSASAASRVISQLEERLGFALFDRSGKALTLTEDGADFYRVAMESMRAWQRLEDYSRERDRKKTLRIAVLARHCSDVIIPAVVTIMKRHEETLRVTMDVHASRDIHYSKYSHPFDVGFGTLLSSHDDLEKTALAHLPFCLVASRQHSIARYDTIGQEDCREAEFVILSRDTLEQEHTRRLMPAHARIAAEVSSTQVALRFVKRNVGVHFTDRLAAKSVSNDCKLIELKEPLTIPFYVFWPKAAGRIDPAVFECTREIAASIKAAGIGLTPEGEAFLRDH